MHSSSLALPSRHRLPFRGALSGGPPCGSTHGLPALRGARRLSVTFVSILAASACGSALDLGPGAIDGPGELDPGEADASGPSDGAPDDDDDDGGSEQGHDAAAPPSWLDRERGRWHAQLNPAWRMDRQHYGSGAMGPMGVPNRAHAQAELASDRALLTTQDLGAALRPPDRTADTWMKNGVAVLSRVPDPSDPSQWAFRFFLDKVRNGPAESGKYRVELNVPATQSPPWGAEEWGLTAFRLVGAGWAGIAPRDATIVYQYHSGPGSDVKNPPFSVSVAGSGSMQGTEIAGPPGTHLRIQVRRQRLDAPSESEPATTTFVVAPPTDTWIWVIVQDRSGYLDEGNGSGPPFLKCWVAIGDGPPQLVLDHRGRWASPGSHNGHYPKTGMYYVVPALWSEPLGATREILSKGLYVLRAEDVAGATAPTLLTQLKQAAKRVD